MKKFVLALLLIFLFKHALFSQVFTQLTNDPVVSDDRYSEGASWGDINNDGDLDLFVPDLYTNKKNILFINNGDGSFTEVTNGPVVTDVSTSSGGNFADFENDGDLDLFVSNYLGNNNLIISGELVSSPFFKGFNLIAVNVDESGGGEISHAHGVVKRKISIFP